MEKIKTYDELRAAIAELEVRQEQQVMELRYQADLAMESLKPGNLIKSVFNDNSVSSKSSNLISNSVGLSAGYIAKILVQGVMRRPLNRLVGTAIMFGMQSFIARNPNALRSIGAGFFNLLRKRKKEKQMEIDMDN